MPVSRVFLAMPGSVFLISNLRSPSIRPASAATTPLGDEPRPDLLKEGLSSAKPQRVMHHTFTRSQDAISTMGITCCTNPRFAWVAPLNKRGALL